MQSARAVAVKLTLAVRRHFVLELLVMLPETVAFVRSDTVGSWSVRWK